MPLCTCFFYLLSPGNHLKSLFRHCLQVEKHLCIFQVISLEDFLKKSIDPTMLCSLSSLFFNTEVLTHHHSIS